MARAAWRGYVAIGQLGIPVRLHSGSRSVAPRFVTIHDKDGAPVERTMKCSYEQREIPASETVKAIEHNGSYIPISEQELERSATSPVKMIIVEQFCDTGDVPPIYYEKPYFMVAAKGGERAYALLREVLARERKAALARYFLYRREHIGLISAHRDLLVLQQLRYASEITPRSDLKTPALPKPSPKEVEALSEVVRRHGGPLYIEDYHDTYEEQLQELIDRKIRGVKTSKSHRLPATSLKGDDHLMDALQETLQTPAGLGPGEKSP